MQRVVFTAYITERIWKVFFPQSETAGLSLITSSTIPRVLARGGLSARLASGGNSTVFARFLTQDMQYRKLKREKK
jgi:hypothetical protein